MLDNSNFVHIYVFLTLTTLLGLSIAIYCRRFKDIFAAYREWIYFNLMANLGLFALLATNVYPGGITVIIANIFLSLTHMFIWAFSRKLMGRQFNYRFCFYLFPAYLLSIGYFTYVDESIYNRILISSVVFFIFSLGAACELLIPERKTRYTYSYFLLLIAFFLNGLKWTFYILTTPFIEKLTNNFFEIQDLALSEVGLLTAATEIMLIISVIAIIFEKSKYRNLIHIYKK